MQPPDAPPQRPRRILHLEDDPRDAEFIEHVLTQGEAPLAFVRVQNQAAFETAVAREPFDLVICDYNLRGYDGLAAMAHVRERRPDTPVIIVSGTLGEDEAVRCLQLGATDYLLKGRLDRLAPAVERAIKEATERRRRREAEAQMLHAQKLENVALLAGGIAHDFNNLLTVINGAADLALAQVADTHPARDDLEEIRVAGERAAALTRQLLAFSRRQVLRPELLDLNVVLGEAERLLRRLLPERVRLVVTTSKRPVFVRADRSQMEQVIVNLAVNARDAIDAGGMLAIQVRQVDSGTGGDALSYHQVPAGPYAMLTVTDTGRGMDEATRARAFDPFFTTKGTGQGTGLGLSTVDGIVRQSGGSIALWSELGRGTTVQILLPRVDGEAVEGATTTCHEAVAAARNGATILVVEDQRALARMAKRMLESGGYTTMLAADAGEALRLLRDRVTSFDLILTDIALPAMSGLELGDEVARAWPHVKVVYMSGHTDDPRLPERIQKDAAVFLPKPFTQAHLLAKVREALNVRPV